MVVDLSTAKMGRTNICSSPLMDGGSGNSACVTSETRKRFKRRIHRPEPNSLYDILQEYAGVPLFLRPICWTDLHTELLGARFIELPPCTTPVPQSPTSHSPFTPSGCHLRPSPTATTLSRELTALLSTNPPLPFFNVYSIKTILSTLFPEKLLRPKTLPELHLYFGRRVYRNAVKLQLLWNHPSADEGTPISFASSTTTRPAESFSNLISSSPIADQTQPTDTEFPMLAYVGRAQLDAVRRNLFRVVPGPGRTANEPVLRLQQLRSKQLVPSNSDHDAHFVGIFIAMAQKQFYWDTPSMSQTGQVTQFPLPADIGTPAFRDVTVQLLTHDVDTAEFIVYIATVKAELLRKFDNPFTAGTHSSVMGSSLSAGGIEISYSRVPIWPILGLKERLGKTLGREIIGEFDEFSIETWEEKSDGDRDSLKRRRDREALAEVLSNSFDEEGPVNPVLLSKRRRLLAEGNQVGVMG
jgi:hypothetical protein